MPRVRGLLSVAACGLALVACQGEQDPVPSVAKAALASPVPDVAVKTAQLQVSGATPTIDERSTLAARQQRYLVALKREEARLHSLSPEQREAEQAKLKQELVGE